MLPKDLGCTNEAFVISCYEEHILQFMQIVQSAFEQFFLEI